MAIVDVAKMFKIQDVGNHNFVEKKTTQKQLELFESDFIYR